MSVCFDQKLVVVICIAVISFIAFTMKMCHKAFETSLQKQMEFAKEHQTIPPTITTPVETLLPKTQIQVTPPSQMTLVPLGGLNNQPFIDSNSRYNTEYKHLGYLLSDTVVRNGEKLTLPLYGRRKYPRSERYEYYIVNSNNIQIPFAQKSEKEIWDGDSVTVPTYEGQFIAEIYPQKEHVYNPNPFPVTIS
jgi:hypothetical protein